VPRQLSRKYLLFPVWITIRSSPLFFCCWYSCRCCSCHSLLSLFQL